MFLQIHTLTSYHASLLNRDDAGLAKRIPFGDSSRLRISSQCLKRHWREKLQSELSMPSGWRTRHFFSRIVLPRVCQEGVEEGAARELTRTLIHGLMKEKAKDSEQESEDGSKDAKGESQDGLFLKQPVLFGKPEADYMVSMIVKAAKEKDLKKAQANMQESLKQNKENFKAMLQQAGYGEVHAGFEGAMFGRFVTSDVLSRVDAPVHVAHAFTVHGLDTEVDYFTVVDDLNVEEETGAAHAGDMELGAGIFYGYVAIDIPLLVSNITGCETKDWKKQESEVVASLLKELINAITTTTPGAKLGSTAPYAYSDFLLLEAGKKQPRSLANAFLKSISRRGDVMQEAIDALATQMSSVDKMYGDTAECRSIAATKQWSYGSMPSKTVPDCAEHVLYYLFEKNGNGNINP